MGLFSKIINDVSENYSTVSVNCVKELCKDINIEYKNTEELLEYLNEKGYELKVKKYIKKGESVGQYLLLMDSAGNLIKGYRVWIDFLENFMVYKEKIMSMDEVRI